MSDDAGTPADQLWVVVLRHSSWFDDGALVFRTREAAEKHAAERIAAEGRNDYIAVMLADQVNEYANEMARQAMMDD